MVGADLSKIPQTLTTTQIYAHVLNDELTEAMATLPEP